jgi:hypothetical protein
MLEAPAPTPARRASEAPERNPRTSVSSLLPIGIARLMAAMSIRTLKNRGAGIPLRRPIPHLAIANLSERQLRIPFHGSRLYPYRITDLGLISSLLRRVQRSILKAGKVGNRKIRVLVKPSNF